MYVLKQLYLKFKTSHFLIIYHFIMNVLEHICTYCVSKLEIKYNDLLQCHHFSRPKPTMITVFTIGKLIKIRT